MNSDFIPAKESRPVINFFTTYTNFMLWRRFRDIHVQQLYLPDSNSKTVYFMNHHYWWDGLLPLYLNENRFKQKARALMEDKQMREYPFFSRIGAFSIDLDKREVLNVSVETNQVMHTRDPEYTFRGIKVADSSKMSVLTKALNDVV